MTHNGAKLHSQHHVAAIAQPSKSGCSVTSPKSGQTLRHLPIQVQSCPEHAWSGQQARGNNRCKAVFSLRNMDVTLQLVPLSSLAYADGKREKRESMAQAPLWLLSRWIEVGERLGAWNLHPPMGVINHVLVPGGRDNVLKSGIMKIYGWWHWEVNRLLRGPGLVPSAPKVGCSIERSAQLHHIPPTCRDSCCAIL